MPAAQGIEYSFQATIALHNSPLALASSSRLIAASTTIPYRGTIILIHGFPDISFGWRYQIPFLTNLGLTVVALDCIGYGRTDSPLQHIRDYTYKRISDDIAELCRQLLSTSS